MLASSQKELPLEQLKQAILIAVSCAYKLFGQPSIPFASYQQSRRLIFRLRKENVYTGVPKSANL